MSDQSKYQVKFTNFNYDTMSEGEEVVAPLNRIAKALTTEKLFSIFESWLNCVGSSAYKRGTEFGVLAHETHRTLQGLMVNFFAGFIMEIAKERWTDRRNEQAIRLARKIADSFSEEDLQRYI